jgi:peptide/nickel transport system substrate-binding protein
MKRRLTGASLLVLVLLLGIVLVGCQPAEPTEEETEEPEETAEATEEPEETAEPSPETEPPAVKPQIIIAYDSDIDTIDPMQFRSLGAYDATANLFEPLLIQVLEDAGNGEFIGQVQMEGAVAERYEVSDDGTVFTFYLRQDAQFADGTPITANDYKYTFDRAMLGTGYIGLLTPFMALSSADNVVVVDDYTLQVTTDQPAALTETIIGFQVFGALSQAAAEANSMADDPWADAWQRNNTNSSGPYSITEWNAGVEYFFEPNPNYWQGPDFIQNSGVVFRVVPDAATRVQLLRAGDVDVALGIPYGQLAEMEDDPNISIHAIPTTRVYHLGMNTAVEPLDDKLVRQAISIAVPYDAILENVIYGYGQKPTSPIPNGMEGHTDEFWTYGEQTLDDARALLDEAGYSDGFTIALTVPQEDQSRVDAATWVQAGLAEIGITVNINAVPTAEFSALINSHELPFFITEWYSWGNDPFYQLTWNFKCGSFPNFVNYCNEELDEIIAQGTFSRDPEERAELARRAQEILVDEAVWAYLYQPDWIVATRSNVSGIALFNDLTLRYAYIGKTE